MHMAPLETGAQNRQAALTVRTTAARSSTALQGSRGTGPLPREAVLSQQLTEALLTAAETPGHQPVGH